MFYVGVVHQRHSTKSSQDGWPHSRQDTLHTIHVRGWDVVRTSPKHTTTDTLLRHIQTHKHTSRHSTAHICQTHIDTPTARRHTKHTISTKWMWNARKKIPPMRGWIWMGCCKSHVFLRNTHNLAEKNTPYGRKNTPYWIGFRFGFGINSKSKSIIGEFQADWWTNGRCTQDGLWMCIHLECNLTNKLP